MTDEVYRRLAKRVNEIPNGFPATESGVELELLAKMFAPEEAHLASVMKLRPEPAAEIAERATVDSDTALEHLEAMAAKGLISVSEAPDGSMFSLRPFVVGFYEEWLPRMDEEFASLFEKYYQETHGGLLGEGPAVHRVIPVDAAVPFEVEIFPYESARALLENAKSWGVRDCICRVQQRLIGRGCEHPVETCLVFAPTENAFDGSEITRSLTQEEAFDILRIAEEAGLVHSSGNYRRGNAYICNCCTCSCGVMRGIAEFGIRNAVAHSAFRAVVEPETCIACGKCVDRCSFHAVSLSDGEVRIDVDRCAGCGLCVTTCPVGALRLERAQEDASPKPPATILHWMRDRAETRGISLEDMT